jgi:hypothetical protein
MDTIHKTLSPATYPCDLCAVTYGAFSMRPEWRDWLKAQPWRAEFAYRDAFRAAHGVHADEPLPAIFRTDGDGALSVLVSASDLRGIGDVASLMGLLEARLNDARAD